MCGENVEVDNHILEHISLYLDDELQNGERLAVEIHIKSCPDCRAALEAEREFVSAIRSARPVYTAPASLQANIAQLVQSSGRRTKFVSFAADHCSLRSFAARVSRFSGWLRQTHSKKTAAHLLPWPSTIMCGTSRDNYP